MSRKKAPRSEAALRRRSQLAALARADILRAAETAFAAGGYHATTLQQIAQAAGFTAASLYTYFPSKEAIYRELVDTVHQELSAPFTCKYPREASFEERVETLIVAFCEVAEHRRKALGFFHRVLSRGEPRPVMREHAIGEFLDLLQEWMGKNAPPEALRCSCDEGGLVLWALLNGYLVRWVERQASDEGLKGAAERIRDIFLHGVSSRKRMKVAPRP